MRTYETKIALLEPSRSQSHRALGATLQQDAIALLALIGIPRGAELKLFDLMYVADHGHKYVFQLAGTVKNVEAGEKPKPVEFHRHTEDKKLCPMACIDQYLALTHPWRVNGQPSAFFLCQKDVLLLADVDTKVFKPILSGEPPLRRPFSRGSQLRRS